MWKVLKTPPLGVPSKPPFELCTKDKPFFECAEITEFKAGCSVLSLEVQISDQGCLKLDAMESEYNSVLNEGNLHACSLVKKKGGDRKDSAK